MHYLQITVGGKPYRSPFLDLMKLNIREAQAIKTNSGLSITEWLTGLPNLDDPNVLASLVFVLMSRAGDATQWSDIEDIGLEELAESIKVVDEPDPVPDSPEPAPRVAGVPIPGRTPKGLVVNGTVVAVTKKAKTSS